MAMLPIIFFFAKKYNVSSIKLYSNVIVYFLIFIQNDSSCTFLLQLVCVTGQCCMLAFSVFVCMYLNSLSYPL